MAKFNIPKLLGLWTRSGRNERPLGALDDMNNLVLNDKMNKLTLRSGYASDIAANPTSVDSTIMTTVNQFFCKPLTNPTTENVDVLLGTDGSANKWFFMTPWYNPALARQTTWLKLGERTTTTINGAPTSTNFVLAAGSTADDYYNGWIVYNSTRSAFAHVLDYTGSSKSVKTRGECGSPWATGDTVTLYRHFHKNYTFVPTYNAMPSDTPAAAESIGNNLVISGGRGSDANLAGMWIGYINHSYGADFSSGNYKFAYAGTYADEMDLTTGAGLSLQDAVVHTAVGAELNTSARWFLGLVAEDDNGIRSTLLKPAVDYVDVVANKGVEFHMHLAPDFNKRIRYMNVFLGYTYDKTKTSIDWSQYNYITRIDLTASGIWTSGTTPLESAAFGYDINDWNNRGVDLVTFLGTTSYTNGSCSFSFARLLANRFIVGNVYDYTNALANSEYIRFSGFGNGVPQYTVLTDNPVYGQNKISPDAGSSIIGMDNYENTLVVFKKKSMYSIGITSDPTSWEIVTISNTIGTDAPKSIVNIGSGILFAKSADDVFFWSGGVPRGLTDQWQKTYRAYVTTANAWHGLFNPTTKTYMLTCDKSDATLVHMIHFNQPIDENRFVWTKHKFAHNATFFATRPSGDLLVSNGTVVYKFSDTATDDASTAIAPYFDTGDYVIDEDKLVRLENWYIAQTYSGTPAGTLDLKIYLDGTSVGSYTGLTKTKTMLRAGLPIGTVLGTRIRMEYNTNATKATMGTAFSIEEVGINYQLLPYVGDAGSLQT